jgi:hypothetical protein
MKETTIFARVATKPISFPDDIEMLYHGLDERGTLTGKDHFGVHFTWEEVQRRFDIDAAFAKECEGYLLAGEPVFLGNFEVTIEVDD